MADSKKKKSADTDLAERREEMTKRLEELRKNPKTWFEFRLILNTPMEVQGRKTFCVSHAKMAVLPSEETGKAIQAMAPILHEVAMSPSQREELKALAKKAAEELRENFVSHDPILETAVRKLIAEYMCHQWQQRDRSKTGESS